MRPRSQRPQPPGSAPSRPRPPLGDMRTSLSSACLMLSAAMTELYVPSASASAAFLGATTLATLSYESMAHTHLHSPSAALEALAALAGVKSGLHVYSLRIRSMIAGLTLSLSYVLREVTKLGSARTCVCV